MYLRLAPIGNAALGKLDNSQCTTVIYMTLFHAIHVYQRRNCRSKTYLHLRGTTSDAFWYPITER